MKYKTFIIILIIGAFFLSGCNRPKQTGVEFDEIDTSQDPIQTPVSSSKPIIKGFKHGTFTIMPVAKYKLSGRVVSKKSYSDDWDGLVSPMDLAMAWGDLTGREYGEYITFSQGSRWYHYKLKEKSPFDLSYVVTHSSNNHIIPDNENIHRAIKSINKKDEVILELESTEFSIIKIA
jgi:hypothetical protein